MPTDIDEDSILETTGASKVHRIFKRDVSKYLLENCDLRIE